MEFFITSGPELKIRQGLGDSSKIPFFLIEAVVILHERFLIKGQNLF